MHWWAAGDVGPQAAAPDVLFLGVHGVDADAGFTTPNVLEAETDRAFVAAARRVVVLADHTKWGTFGISTIAGWRKQMSSSATRDCPGRPGGSWVSGWAGYGWPPVTPRPRAMNRRISCDASSMDLEVSPALTIPASELGWRFSRSSGPAANTSTPRTAVSNSREYCRLNGALGRAAAAAGHTAQTAPRRRGDYGDRVRAALPAAQP